MNDIFKLFKKRSQSGKATNLNEFIQEFNDKDLQNPTNFDRTSKSYISISKSGRVKSKKSHHTARSIKDDLFQPTQQPQQQTQMQQQQQQQQQLNNPTASALVQPKNSSVQNATISMPSSSHFKNSNYYHQNNINNNISRYNNSSIKQQNVYDQHSDNADSSRTSSASQSSLEDMAAYNTNNKSVINNNNSSSIINNNNNQARSSAYNFPFGNSRLHRH